MDEVEFRVIPLAPKRYNRWHVLGLGLNFVSDILEDLSGWAGTMSIFVAQHAMQKEEDKKFLEVISGS